MKFVQKWTDLAVEDAQSIDDVLMLYDEGEKDHIGPHSLGADDSVVILLIEEDHDRHMNINDLLKSSDDERDADNSAIIFDYNEEDSDEPSQGDPYSSIKPLSCLRRG